MAGQTKVNEKYVTTIKIQRWLVAGYSVREIALIWNQGKAGKCGKGKNSQGVAYDSCEYATAVVGHYSR